MKKQDKDELFKCCDTCENCLYIGEEIIFATNIMFLSKKTTVLMMITIIVTKKIGRRENNE